MTEGQIPVTLGFRSDRRSSGEMWDSVEVFPPDLGFPSLSGDDLNQVDGGEVSPSTARKEGVDLFGCSDLVLGGDSKLLPSVEDGSAMDGASRLPAVAIELPPGADADFVCVQGLGSMAMVCPASVNAGDVAAAVVGEPQSTVSSLVSFHTASQSQLSPALVCSAQQRDDGVVGDGGELGVEIGVGDAASVMPTDLVCSSMFAVNAPAAELALGDGGADGLQMVQGGTGCDALLLPTASFCSNSPYLPSDHACPLFPTVDTIFDGGCVREEVRVSSTARGAVRTQPTDGLCQPPSPPVKPVSERVEKEQGILGGAQ
ncbi:hypothetical protein Dimus_006270, partial [Dionaea muscipula]